MKLKIYLDENATSYLLKELDREKITYLIQREEIDGGELNAILVEYSPFLLNHIFIGGVAYAKGAADKFAGEVVANQIIEQALQNEAPATRPVIIREIKQVDKESYFAVSTSEYTCLRCFTYREDAAEGIWSREHNLKAAMEYAKRLEAGEGRTETVIYKTKNDE
jgi:hypothetical protein